MHSAYAVSQLSPAALSASHVLCLQLLMSSLQGVFGIGESYVSMLSASRNSQIDHVV
jgi:hypothetical protein